MEMIKEYIRPELLVLLPVLYFFGAAIKSSPVKNWKIPYILGAVGIFLSMVYVLAQCPVTNTPELLSAVFTALTQGILIAGSSVYINNLIKQGAEAKALSVSSKSDGTGKTE